MVTWDIVAISMLVLGIIGFFLYIVYHASVERKYIDVLIGRGILSIDSGVLFAGVDRPSLISAVLPSSYPERARFGQIDSDKLVVILDAFKESYRDTLGVFVITKLDCDSGIGLHAVARSRLRAIQFYQLVVKKNKHGPNHLKYCLHRQRNSTLLPDASIEQVLLEYMQNNSSIEYAALNGEWLALGYSKMRLQKLFEGVAILPVDQVSVRDISNHVDMLRGAVCMNGGRQQCSYFSVEEL